MKIRAPLLLEPSPEVFVGEKRTLSLALTFDDDADR